MTNDNTAPADTNSVGTSSERDFLPTAPEDGSQSIDLAVRVKELEASNLTLTENLLSATGRVDKMRQEREASNGVSMAGATDVLKEMAHSQENGNNEGLSSRVDTIFSKASEESTQVRLQDTQTRYSGEIASAIKDAGMDENDPSLREADELFTNATTMAGKAEAVTMVKDITNAKRLSDSEARVTAQTQAADETREKTLK